MTPSSNNPEAAAHRSRLIKAGVRLKYTKPPSVDTFAEEMSNRMTAAFAVAMNAPQPPQWIFINPIAVISCVQLSVVFFEEVRRLQAEWCRRSKYLFPRQVRKSVKVWDPHEPDLTKHARYLRRCLCFTGLMLHAGAPIPDHEWKMVEAETMKAALTTPMTASDSQTEDGK